MARREFHTLSAALIICVMSVIALSVSSYVLYGKLDLAQGRAAEAEHRAAEGQATLATTTAEIGRLKELIGHPRNAEMPTVEGAYRIDLAATMPPATLANNEPASYRTLIYSLLRATRTAVGKELETQGAVEVVRAQLADVQARHEKQLASEKSLRDKLSAELKDVRATAAAEYQREHATWQNLFADYSARLKELAQWQDEYHALAKRSARELNLADQRYQNMRASWENLQHYEFDAPYGRILEINAVRKTVVLDLGSDDYLPRNLMFLVYEPGLTGGARKSAAKGRLEVTTVLGPHLAEARIVEESLRDPLLRGDVLYTPLWKPGQPRQFALAGSCDLSGDGNDDRAYLRKLVENAGGIVAADVSATGERSGELTLNVRFVIVGQPPHGASTSKEVLAYETFLAEAKELRIELVPLEKFLGLAGWPAPTQVVRLDSGAKRSFRERGEK